MKSKKTHLPVFGIGPIFIVSLFLITFIFTLINYLGYLDLFIIDKYRFLFFFVGSLLIIEGLFIWICAVFFSRIDKNIKQNKLVTSGVYKYVRNPIYSAFIFLFSGVLFINHNYLLLLIPFLFWLSLTIIMIKTEEKWLIDKYGKEYTDYCKKTNRCIPFFPKKYIKENN
ncbi:MAG: methyltransferase family protein [Pleomorphochaeta sp.]